MVSLYGSEIRYDRKCNMSQDHKAISYFINLQTSLIHCWIYRHILLNEIVEVSSHRFFQYSILFEKLEYYIFISVSFTQ